MRTTASFELFPDAPSERAMARARWLAREGRLGDAEAAYRETVAAHPPLKAAWAEWFELLRRQGRRGEALALADRACAQFGADQAFPLTLRGAALIELNRYREAIADLERALEADPDLALVWHELGYAAYRLGDRNRALLALDRAFALEPHGETLRLRGRILRDAGRYQAAEVAFEGAAQSAEHEEQWNETEREIAVTRRYALFAPKKPEDLGPAERWFADTGAVLLAASPADEPPADEALVDAFAELAADSGWRFGQLVTLDGPAAAWDRLAAKLALARAAPDALEPERIPLLAALEPRPGDPAWDRAVQALERFNAGLVFVLEHPSDATPAADVVGVLADGGRRRARTTAGVAARLAEAQHPAARLAGRRLVRP